MSSLEHLLVPLPVLLPLAGAGAAVVLSKSIKIQRLISLSVVALVTVIGATLVWLVDRGPTLVVHVGGWSPTLGISLVADRLAALMVTVSAIMVMAVLVYSVSEGSAAEDRAEGAAKSPVPVFHPSMLVLVAGVSTTFLSGDLFHLYVGFEMLLGASFVLLTLGGEAPRVRSGMTYVIVSLMSSLVFLIAIAMIYAATGAVNLAAVATRLTLLPYDTRFWLELMLLAGFAVKAALFPVSGWLPDSYPTAPAPVTAVFAGLLTKVGVYAILRTETLLFPGGPFQTLLLWASLLTMVVGIVGAVAQDDIKRILSFTLISHIGFMTLGIAIGSLAGISATVFYVVHHILVQTALFLVCGLIERFSGTTSLRSLGGLLSHAPVIAGLFALPALSLAGIPPLSGFLGKLGLLQATVDFGGPLGMTLLAGSLVTSLLTIYAMARVWRRAFWQTPSIAVVKEREPIPMRMWVPTGVVVALGVAVAVLSGPLYGLTGRTAAELLDRNAYAEEQWVIHQVERP